MEKEWTIDRFLKTPPEGGLDYVAGRETWKNLFQCCFSGEKLEEWFCLPKTWNFLLSGERGMGKTYLAKALAAEAGKKGYRYLELSGHELSSKNEEQAEERVSLLSEKLLSGEKIFFLLKNVEDTGRAASALADVLEEGKEADVPVITAALTEDLRKVPGVLARLFRILQLEAPDGQERKAYFQLFWENSFLKAPGKLTVDKMAEITEGLSFAQLDDVRMYMNGGMCRLAVPQFSSVEAFVSAVEQGKVALAEKRFRDVTAAVRKGAVSKTEPEVQAQKNTTEPGTLEVLTEVLKNLSFGANTAAKQPDLLDEDFFAEGKKVPKDIPTDKVLAEDSPMNPENLNFDL